VYYSLVIVALVILACLEIFEDKNWAILIHLTRILGFVAALILVFNRQYFTSIRVAAYVILITSIWGSIISPTQSSFHFLVFPFGVISLYFSTKTWETITYAILCGIYFCIAQYVNTNYFKPEPSNSYFLSLVLIYSAFFFASVLYFWELRYLEHRITTQNKELHEQNKHLESINKELLSINDFKNKLFSIVSHDLKNPFSSVYGITDLLKKNFSKNPPEKNEMMISIIHKNIDVINVMLNDLMTWARSHSDSIQISEERVSVRNICESIRESLSQQLSEKSIKLLNQVPEWFYIESDSTIISIIIRNFLQNAIKFSKDDGVIIIECLTNSQSKSIRVVDHGIGIPPEIEEKIGKSAIENSGIGTRNEVGHGLGLSLCFDLANVIGGSISVSNNVGSQGTTAEITLPNN